MDKKTQEKVIHSLDTFDQTVSFWQLIKSGDGRGQKKLEHIIDSLHNGQMERSDKPLSLVISGDQGLRTHSRSFLRAVGLGYPLDVPSHILNSSTNEIYHFFNPTRPSDSYIISSASLLYQSVLKVIYEVASTGHYSFYNHVKKFTEVVPVVMPVILTTNNLGDIPKYFLEQIDHIIEIENYSNTQLDLIILQRLKYCNLDYDDEKIFALIRDYGRGRLTNIIRLLKDAMTVMLADSRRVLTVDDIEKAKVYM